MKKTLVDPFTVNLPHLDLHGEIQDSARYLINEFISDNYKLKNEKVVIIHGKSTNILKNATQSVLKANKLVENYYIDALNTGQTIVEIKKNTSN